jgi:hypothetical protein
MIAAFSLVEFYDALYGFSTANPAGDRSRSCNDARDEESSRHQNARETHDAVDSIVNV